MFGHFLQEDSILALMNYQTNDQIFCERESEIEKDMSKQMEKMRRTLCVNGYTQVCIHLCDSTCEYV